MFPRTRGRDAIERSFVSLFDIFPDWHMVFEEPVIDGDRAVLCCSIRASQVGAFMGLSGTGRRFEFQCVLAFSLHQGLISHERRIYDFTGMLIQLGVLRGKPAL
jgi:predicted ester cyclase